jgi:hypothetical protein
MRRPPAITTTLGRKPGELVVHLPPGWSFRLRRVVRSLVADTLPDPRERGLSARQRATRLRARRRTMQLAVERFVSEVLTAEIVGKEIALGARTRYGTRRGSLREHVQAILREVSGA